MQIDEENYLVTLLVYITGIGDMSIVCFGVHTYMKQNKIPHRFKILSVYFTDQVLHEILYKIKFTWRIILTNSI